MRTFPAKALRGKLVVQSAPEVLLDGKPDRLSPGARIHGPDNLLIMSARLTGQTYTVNYVRDGHGLIHEVWILTPEEAAIKRPARGAHRTGPPLRPGRRAQQDGSALQPRRHPARPPPSPTRVSADY